MRTRDRRVGVFALTFLLLAVQACETAQPPVSAQARDRFETIDPGLAVELIVNKEKFKQDEAIIVDVFVKNLTGEDLLRNEFSPFSSSVGLPTFIITLLEQGREFKIPPGLYVEKSDWRGWYQPAAGAAGRLVLPPGKRIHLLHGDLRRLMQDAREHSQGVLIEEKRRRLERPGESSTMKHSKEISRCTRDVLRGGSYEMAVWAYSRSNSVRFEVERSTRVVSTG
jgi:hypothetical protein